MLKNKIFLSLIGFYIFWLGVLPLILSKAVQFVCQNISNKTNYVITVENPRIVSNILPVIKINVDKINISLKSNSDFIEATDLKSTIRIFPLLSGNIHLNNFHAESISTTINLRHELELDKDFFTKLKNTKVSCDSISINKFETQLFQKGIKNPIKHYGNDVLLQKKNRYLKFQMKSNLNIAGQVSYSNWNLYIPKDNDISIRGVLKVS